MFDSNKAHKRKVYLDYGRLPSYGHVAITKLRTPHYYKDTF